MALTKIALERYHQPMTHERLFPMHREILKGETGFPQDSIGAYVGDMKTPELGELLSAV